MTTEERQLVRDLTPLDRETLERLCRVHQSSPIGMTTGMRLGFDDEGSAIVHWQHNRDFDHALHEVHGGLIATMLDTAGWFTAAAAHGGWVMSTDFQVRLLQGTKDENLRARGRLLKFSRRLTIVGMDVWSETGEHVATGNGAFTPTGWPFPPPEVPG